MINKILVKNFKLFKNSEINLDKLNFINGINHDDIEQSSNGSGKSTIKDMIVFGLYGEGNGINLKDLISIGEKECSVKIELNRGSEHFVIIRKIPSDLSIFVDDKEIQFNTNTLKQKWINEIFGDCSYFRKYRMIDYYGVNLLDLGIISLRKELMNFVDDLFTGIRKNLLAKKLERETYNVDKRLYTFYLSTKRQTIIENGLNVIKEDCLRFQKDKDAQQGIVNQIKTEITSRERTIANRKREIEEAQRSGTCPILKIKCSQITKQITPEQQEAIKKQEIALVHEIETFRSQIDNESDALGYYEATLDSLRNKESKARECLMKMKEASKFAAYKFTLKDVLLYTEAIKVLDSFAGQYINDWLGQLALIINDLLRNVNLQIEFNTEKDFIRIKNGDNELKYEMLSSGQKCFLSAIFKLAMLIHNGDTEGIIIADEGLNTMDEINFAKFIEICKTLPFQFIAIYQDAPEIKDVNLIQIERKNGISIIKES